MHLHTIMLVDKEKRNTPSEIQKYVAEMLGDHYVDSFVDGYFTIEKGAKILNMKTVNYIRTHLEPVPPPTLKKVREEYCPEIRHIFCTRADHGQIRKVPLKKITTLIGKCWAVNAETHI